MTEFPLFYHRIIITTLSSQVLSKHTFSFLSLKSDPPPILTGF